VSASTPTLLLGRGRRRSEFIADFSRLHGDRLIVLPGVRPIRTFFVRKEGVDNAPLDF
jgi:Lrp/AsnC family leucine-responsive transcriptional regulator